MTEEELARFDTLKTNYSKLKSIEITNENKELYCPDLDLSLNRKQLMAPFKVQFKNLLHRNRKILKREP